MDAFFAAIAAGDQDAAVMALRLPEAPTAPPAAAFQTAVNKLRKAQSRVLKLQQDTEAAERDWRDAQARFAQSTARLTGELDVAHQEVASHLHLLRQLAVQEDASAEGPPGQGGGGTPRPNHYGASATGRTSSSSPICPGPYRASPNSYLDNMFRTPLQRHYPTSPSPSQAFDVLLGARPGEAIRSPRGDSSGHSRERRSSSGDSSRRGSRPRASVKQRTAPAAAPPREESPLSRRLDERRAEAARAFADSITAPLSPEPTLDSRPSGPPQRVAPESIRIDSSDDLAEME